ncbi:MAG: sigma factor-like helix-turn-helix DNA-binding protein, partial [Candidatus Hodgkinia cicadicola]
MELLKLSTGSKEVPIVPSDEETRSTNRRLVQSALAQLSPREEEIVMLRCTRPAPSMREIGVKFNLSKERIRQLLDRSIKRLRVFASSNVKNPPLFLQTSKAKSDSLSPPSFPSPS